MKVKDPHGTHAHFSRETLESRGSWHSEIPQILTYPVHTQLIVVRPASVISTFQEWAATAPEHERHGSLQQKASIQSLLQLSAHTC